MEFQAFVPMKLTEDSSVCSQETPIVATEIELPKKRVVSH